MKSTDIFAKATSIDNVHPDSQHHATTLSFWHRLQGFFTGKRDGARLSNAHFKHMQYQKHNACERLVHGRDNFHSPVMPHEYVTWRLVPEMEFYQTRIPKYNRRNTIFQVCILGTSITSTFLSAINQHKWTAIVAALSSSLCAWQEFNSTSKKLVRYSGIAESLGQVLLWWQSLSEA